MKVERAIENYLLLLFGKLTGYNYPVSPTGDPTYVKAQQAAELAAEGIRRLSAFLPAEAAQKTVTAVEALPPIQQPTEDEVMLNAGSLGGTIHHGSSGAPGCCVSIHGHIVCVRVDARKASAR